MRQAPWLWLTSVLTAATVAGCDSGARSGQNGEVEKLRQELKKLREDLDAENFGTGKNVKLYFEAREANRRYAGSFHNYVEDIAALACDLRRQGGSKVDGAGICGDTAREKVSPPTYPPKGME